MQITDSDFTRPKDEYSSYFGRPYDVLVVSDDQTTANMDPWYSYNFKSGKKSLHNGDHALTFPSAPPHCTDQMTLHKKGWKMLSTVPGYLENIVKLNDSKSYSFHNSDFNLSKVQHCKVWKTLHKILDRPHCCGPSCPVLREMHQLLKISRI